MRRTRPLGLILALVLGATACQEQVTDPSPGVDSIEGSEIGDRSSVPPGSLSLQVAEYERGSLDAEFGLTDSYFPAAADRAINPGSHVCPATTPLIDWLIGDINEVVAEGGLNALLQIIDLGAADVPTFEALFFQNEETPQFFGPEGQFTNVMNRTDRNIRRFWDIPSDDILLLAMHGSVLLEVERVAPVYQLLFGGTITEAQALAIAKFVRDVVLSFESLDEGDFPFFTFNAFAFNGRTVPPFGSIPDKIVMGDGVLEGYEALGFGDVAAQAIFAHEFAHHIQFENGYFQTDEVPSLDPAGPDQAERTRYFELMADAMAAYYLTHKRGATLNWWRVEQFLRVFFNVGDCGFSNPGHHGTPNQRLRAARFGFDLALDAQKQGLIMASDDFHDLFVVNYLGFIQPDAGSGAEDPTVGPGKSRAAM